LTREKPAVGEHIRVLVLEDEQVDLIALEHALDKIDSSITLLAVTNRNDFLRALMDFEPQIIVSDYALPGFDGISALGLRNEICPEVPFILTSGILALRTMCKKVRAAAYTLRLNAHCRKREHEPIAPLRRAI
jgi:DNA-binding NtrC family response regulator